MTDIQEWLKTINLQQAETVFTILAFFFVISAICLVMILYLRRLKKNEEERAEAEKKAEQNPESLRRRWDVYFVDYKILLAMNVRQNRFVFYIALFMIIAGFILISVGFAQDSRSQTILPQSLAVIIAGVVTEFIAGSILIIFRSVAAQTMEHSKSLEKFVSIGIAMDMLDQLPKKVAEQDLRSRTAADLAKLVITHQLGSAAVLTSPVVTAENRNVAS